MTKYQFSKTEIFDANRRRVGLDGRWADQFVVAVLPFDSTGEFAHEPLKVRGYEFGGKNMSIIGKKWVRAFATMDEAEAEIDELCSTGV